MDKAGKQYWENMWLNSCKRNDIDVNDNSLRNYINIKFHNFFVTIFKKINTKGMSLLEIGCADSNWLPYFAKQFSFNVTGIDYSEQGCRQAQHMLKQHNLNGKIVLSDLFEPPLELVGKFNVVVSFGVLEHYEDTEHALKAFSKFLKPGGLMITNIPNMTGLIGFLQRILNRPVYDIHVPLTKKDLKESHKNSGLDVLCCEYFMSNSFGVVNLHGTNGISCIIKKIVMALLSRFSMLIWLLEKHLGDFKATKTFSPYVNCVSRKPAL